MKTSTSTSTAPLPPLTSALAVVGRHDDEDERMSTVPSAIAALPHVAALVSDFLDQSTSQLCTISRACARNHMGLLLRLLTRSTGASGDEYEKAREAGKGLVSAVQHDNFEMVTWLHAYCPRAYTRVAMEAASKTGKLALLQWIAGHFECVAWSPIFAELAAAGGHLDTLKWIWSHPKSSSFSDRNAIAAIEYAAVNGHLAIVMWLNEHRQSTSDGKKNHFANARVHASRRGHHQVATYLVKSEASQVHTEYSLGRVVARCTSEMSQWFEKISQTASNITVGA